MSAMEPTVAITRRGMSRDAARFQSVEFTVATAPVASAAANAFESPGTRRHGRLGPDHTAEHPRVTARPADDIPEIRGPVVANQGDR